MNNARNVGPEEVWARRQAPCFRVPAHYGWLDWIPSPTYFYLLPSSFVPSTGVCIFCWHADIDFENSAKASRIRAIVSTLEPRKKYGELQAVRKKEGGREDQMRKQRDETERPPRKVILTLPPMFCCLEILFFFSTPCTFFSPFSLPRIRCCHFRFNVAKDDKRKTKRYNGESEENLTLITDIYSKHEETGKLFSRITIFWRLENARLRRWRGKILFCKNFCEPA